MVIIRYIKSWPIFLIGLMFLLYYLVVDDNSENEAPNYMNCLSHLDMEFIGQIDSVYFDTENRNLFTADIKLDSATIHYTFLCFWNPENFFKKGDTIKKISGNHSLFLLKNKSWENVECHEGFSCDKWKDMIIFD